MSYGENFILSRDGKLILLLDHQLDAVGVDVQKVGSPTYLSLEDYINTAGDSGLLSGGTVTDDTDGTITVAAMTGMIYTTPSAVGTLVFFDLAEDASAKVALTDNALNYIYAQYNSGTPQYQVTTTETDISGTDEFVVAIVWREGTDLHISNVGKHIDQFNQQVYRHSFYLDGLERMWGLVTTENGTRQLDVAVGALSWALHELSVSAKTAGSFKLWYNDGSWQEGGAITTIPNTEYNDYGTGLATLTANRYGVYWMYLVTDGDMYGVYGIGDYTLAQALGAESPGDLPPELANIGVLIAKIIVQKSAANFYSIVLPWTTNIAGSAATDHGGLAGLGDVADHPYALLIDGSRNVDAELTFVQGWRSFNDCIVRETDDGNDAVKLNAESAYGQVIIYSAGVEKIILHGDGTSVFNNPLQINSTFNLGGTTTVSAILDEDAMGSDSAVSLATQQSIKKYVDDEIAGVGGGGGGDLLADGTVPMTADWPFGAFALYIGDTVNAQMTVGITINQGANDDEILAFKSSDVAHGMTDRTETDTYAFFRKAVSASGGLSIEAHTEVGDAIVFKAFPTTEVTGFGPGDIPAVYIQTALKSGTGIGDYSAGALLFGVREYGGGAWPMVYAVDVDGRTWQTGTMYINDTANTKMTQGITINQGANDDEVLAFKSSDVAHGYTGAAETDTYGAFKKGTGAAGGLLIVGLRDSGGQPNSAIEFQAYLAENLDTTKTTAALGMYTFYAAQTSGASVQNIVANGNLLVIRGYVGGGWLTRWMCDEDGDTLQFGNVDAYGTTHSFGPGGASSSTGITYHGDSDTTGVRFTLKQDSAEVFKVYGTGWCGIRDIANTGMTMGLTINQWTAGDEILAFKSSLIAHGLTTYGETDTWGLFKKYHGGQGGMQLTAFAENVAQGLSFRLNAFGGQASTTQTTTGSALMDFVATQHNGSNAKANVTAGGNILSVRGRAGGADYTCFIVDIDGDTWQPGDARFGGSTDSVAVADQVSIGGYEIGAGNRVLAISQETVVAADTDETKFSNKMQVRINGATYYIMLTTT